MNKPKILCAYGGDVCPDALHAPTGRAQANGDER